MKNILKLYKFANASYSSPKVMTLRSHVSLVSVNLSCSPLKLGAGIADTKSRFLRTGKMSGSLSPSSRSQILRRNFSTGKLVDVTSKMKTKREKNILVAFTRSCHVKMYAKALGRVIFIYLRTTRSQVEFSSQKEGLKETFL